MPYKKWRIKANLPPQKALREQQQSEMAQLIRSIQVAEKEKLFLVRQRSLHISYSLPLLHRHQLFSWKKLVSDQRE